MNIKTSTEVTSELSRNEIENMIKSYVAKQGYEVIKMEFKTEEKYPIGSHRDELMGFSSSPQKEFSGVKLYLKQK